MHYDYMVASGHSHEPSANAIQMVVDAFKKHGVTLHIDPVHNAIPEHTVIVFDVPGSPFTSLDPNCAGPDAVSFTALKAQYFQPASSRYRRRPLASEWHYGIFGHWHTTDSPTHAANCPPDPDTGGGPDPGSVGIATLPGNDFIIAMENLLGCWTDLETNAPLPCPSLYDPAVAGTFMHELGHNLGLQHGGDESVNFKPNYVSVMNYLYSGSPIPILSYSTTTPSGYSVRVDYSDEKLPDLVEDDLDETLGLQSSHPNDVVFWFIPGSPTIEPFGPAAGPLDWNNDGDTTDINVMIDLNNSSISLPPTDRLTGFDDWAYIRYRLAHPSQFPATPRGTY
ncbi:MAG: hypothetical protein HY293_03715 [Planctomycetes bacterium]|nr:hypothetical protein [Planctomycetota bacterium]